MLNVGFIGCGNMGGALAAAVANASYDIALFLADKNTDAANALGASLSATVCSNEEIAKKCDYIFLAVKPNIIVDVVKEIAETLNPNAVLITMAAGVECEKIKCHTQNSVIRIMPNTPVAVGKGVVLYVEDFAKNNEIKTFLMLLDKAGSLIPIKETLIDAASAVSGCGPAFAYMFIEALSTGGIECGLAADVSLKLAAETVNGAAEMVLKSGVHPAKLRDNVCSPAGSTIAGVHALENAGFRNGVMDCVKASYKRTKELGK